jgi:hypothetical protein
MAILPLLPERVVRIMRGLTGEQADQVDQGSRGIRGLTAVGLRYVGAFAFGAHGGSQPRARGDVASSY